MTPIIPKQEFIVDFHQVDDSFCEEPDVLKRSVDSSDYQMSESGDSGVIDEEASKECEHTHLQDFMDKNYRS
nr:kinesin-like protein KIN-4A [Tanacetum cinerariifolium]